MTKPLIRYPGGKRRLATVIENLLGQSNGIYYEPCVGAGGAFFGRKVRPRSAVLGDRNPRVIGLHTAVRDQPAAVVEALALLPSAGITPTLYEQLRAEHNDGEHAGPTFAARMIWLSRAGFNGLHRENKAGELNVGWGQRPRLTLPSAERVHAVSAALAGVELVCVDFVALLSSARPGDLYYLDPPYLGGFTAYTAGQFGREEHDTLAQFARLAARKGARVLASGYAGGETAAAYAGSRVVWRGAVGHSISADGSRREQRGEAMYLWAPERRSGVTRG